MTETTAQPPTFRSADRLSEDDLPDEPVSYEEFLEITEGHHAEWVDGDIILMTAASNRHQDIADFLTSILRAFAEERDVGTVRSSPFQMRLENRGREPDVMFIASEHTGEIRDQYLDGPADLAVEIISQSSGPRDRGEKFYEYEAAGVREYLIVDPEREDVVLYRLGADGKYRTAFEGEEGTFVLTVLDGPELQAEWFWQDELPKTLDVLRGWNLID